jgi:hypothetical protein
MLRLTTSIFAILLSHSLVGQREKVRILEESQNNRILLYAINETDTDYDVKLTVSGTNFRQSRAKPRFIRVPSASRVHMWTLIPIRGKKANYTFDLAITDSLSSRSLQKEFEKVKIAPRKKIVLYFPELCKTCDTLLSTFSDGIYHYTFYNLSENPEIRQQLQGVLGAGTPIDSLELPIVNLGGKLHTSLESYAQIMEALKDD